MGVHDEPGAYADCAWHVVAALFFPSDIRIFMFALEQASSDVAVNLQLGQCGCNHVGRGTAMLELLELHLGKLA